MWDIRYDSLKGTAGAYKQRESDEKLDASVLWETTSKRVTEFIQSHGRMTFVCLCTREKASVCLCTNYFMRVRECVCVQMHSCISVRERETFHVCVRVRLSIDLCVYLFKRYCSTSEQSGGPGVDARLQISINPRGLFYCSDVAIFYCFKATVLAKVVLQWPKAHYAWWQRTSCFIFVWEVTLQSTLLKGCHIHLS